MLKENRIEMFIRLLFEALETDRLNQKLGFNIGSGANHKGRRQSFRQMVSPQGETVAPLDCVEMMSHSQETHMLVN